MLGFRGYSLMVGDFVYFGKKACENLEILKESIAETKDDFKTFVEFKNVPARVVCISENHIELETKQGYYMRVLGGMIEPIPLDEVILAYNGWVQNEKTKHWHPQETDRICVEVSNTIFHVVHIDNVGIRVSFCVQHLHELQDLLRVCKFTDIADNIRL